MSQRSKGSRISGGKVNEHEFKSLKEENRRLRGEKVGMMKKINQSNMSLMQCETPSRRTPATTSNSWKDSTASLTTTSPTRKGRSFSFCLERILRTSSPETQSPNLPPDCLFMYLLSKWGLL